MTQPIAPAEHRALGFWMSTALVIGNTIGMGIFILPASLAPYGFNAIAGWVLTLVGFLFIARVLAGLASAFPQDEGPYAYTERALGEPTAFMVMWCYWVATWVTNATIAVGVVGYLSILVPAINSNKIFLPLIALSLVWLFVLLNLRGVRAVGRTQVLTTALKLLPMAAVVVLGLWQLVTGPAAYVAHPPTTPISPGAILTASTTAIFAMLGIECACIPAGRVKDPGRTIPLATMAGTTLTALIYIAISVVPMLLIPQAELAASNAPFADLFARFLGGGSAQILAIFVIISGLGALNGWTLVVGEVTMNFAKNGSFPRGLAKVNSKDAPTRAFVLTGVVASLMLLANYNATLVESFTRLSNVVSAANLPLYITCAMAVLVAWRRGQLNVSGSRATVLLVAAAMAIAFCLFAFKGFAPKDLLWALGFAAVGAIVYLFAWFSRRRGASVPSRAT